MYVSRYNLAFEVNEEEKVVLFNPLSGAVDIADKRVLKIIDLIKRNKTIPSKHKKLIHKLFERGHLFLTKDDEKKRIEEMYRRFITSIDNAPKNFVMTITYGCNLRCVYCFQSGQLKTNHSVMSRDVLEKAFNFISLRTKNDNSPPTITIYGGEPLLKTKEHEVVIRKILTECRDKDYSVVVITNGVNLAHYSEILSKYEVNEIQVTLDGVKRIHDKRRPLKGSLGSFDKIVEGVDTVLKNSLNINLRVVADKENIDSIPQFAKFIIEKNWVESKTFRMHIGRICCGCPGEYKHVVLSTDIIVKKLFNFLKNDDELSKLITPWCLGLSRLCSIGVPYPPIFSACPGGRIEFALDLHGHIYPCSSSCGRKEFCIGTFYPKSRLNMDILEKFRNRSVLTMTKCKNCKFSLICGGGCPLENNGKDPIMTPSCRPTRETLQHGFNFYYPRLKQIAKW